MLIHAKCTVGNEIRLLVHTGGRSYHSAHWAIIRSDRYAVAYKPQSRCEYAQGRPAVNSRGAIAKGVLSYARKPSGTVCHHAAIPR
jgi:hypothetical protein